MATIDLDREARPLRHADRAADGPAHADAWPSVDLATRRAAAEPDPDQSPQEAEAVAELTVEPAADPVDQPGVEWTVASETPGWHDPRRPSTLLADLTTAMRATALGARDQALAQVDTDATLAVETIRTTSVDTAKTLRHRADADVEGIREWTKAEIARIRSESETRIAKRRTGLDEELAAEAAAVEQRVFDVHDALARYQAEMAAFFERLVAETDAARLATMAETMPESPVLGAPAVEAPMTTSRRSRAPRRDEPAPAPEPAAETANDVPASGATDMPDAEASKAELVEPAETLEPAETAEASVGEGTVGEGTVGEGEVAEGEVAEAGTAEAAVAEPEVPEPGDVATETSDEQPAHDASAMAVAESEASASADAAVVAEDAEPADAVPDEPARREDGRSFAERLAGLLPHRDEDGGEPRTTQVIVTGLGSVAGIASFKRQLSRIAGVVSVAVSSGPDGEFVFAAVHRRNVHLVDAVPMLQGFGATVTRTGDGVVFVEAQDPDAEA